MLACLGELFYCIFMKREIKDGEQKEFEAIARDLELCDLGEVLTKGKERRQFAQHRARCHAFIREANKRDGLDQMSVDEIEKELGST